ncbi:unnamed protein product [Rotaria sp. Silwood2]|nr:unnamed protein product [Rotaria sp. Silwood2]CAF4093359.1 unnamed protein product [Rotaria sp. Silwood2]
MHLYTLHDLQKKLQNHSNAYTTLAYLHLASMPERVYQGVCYRVIKMSFLDVSRYYYVMKMPNNVIETRNFSSTSKRKAVSILYSAHGQRSDDNNYDILLIFEVSNPSKTTIDLTDISDRLPPISQYEDEEVLVFILYAISSKVTTTNMNDDHTIALEILRYSVNELQRKQIDIHRHIGQLSAVMSDFEYHMAQVRNICESSNNNNNELCQSLLSHLESVIIDTRSALVTSTTSTNDAQQVHDLVHRLYEENQRIADHIDNLLKQDQLDIEIKDEKTPEEDHIQKAIEHIELALEQNIREQEYINKEQEHFENNQKTIETFIQTTEHLHEEALEKLREHIKVLREHNQSLKQYNEQIDTLTKQLPQTLFLSAH